MNWVVLSVCFFAFLLLDEQGDRILAGKKTWFDSVWWRVNLWENRHPLVKYVFTFLIDGFHWTKYFKMFTIWFLVSYLFMDSFIYAFGGAVNLMLLYGLIFNLLHHREKLWAQMKKVK